MGKSWKKKISVYLSALVLALGMTALSLSAQAALVEEKRETSFLAICMPPSTSGFFALYACIPDAVSSVYPWFSISTMEGSGGVTQNTRVRNNEAQMGGSSSATDYESYNGIGSFDGKPYKGARALFYHQSTPLIVCVSKNSGIKSIAGLNGQRFCPGMTGGSTVSMMETLAKFNSITINWMPASLSDAIDAYSDREIVGVAKSSSGNYDGTVIQLNAAHGVDIISLTDDEIAQMCEIYAYMKPYTIPAGTYDFIDHDIKTVRAWASCISNNQMTQEEGYYIVKALCEPGPGRDIRDAAYPSEIHEDWPKNTTDAIIPIHAGMVQYMVEKGIAVPENMIPPEYVPIS
jgi:TRAP transporter TAXI family solute receptor